MRLSNRLTVFVVLLALLAGGLQPAGLLSAARAAQSAPWQDKVDPWVLETAAQGETEFLVFLREQADLSAAARLETKEAKGRYVFDTLRQTANRTQAPLLAELNRLGVEFRPYWVANMVWVRGGPALIEALAQRGDVLKLYANPTVHFDGPIEQAAIPAPDAPEAIEWNILKVRAEQVWAAGYTGQGVVIGGQDTGYDWDHPALQGHYRGWNGSTADHNYSWHDAIHTGGIASCPANSPVPCDDNGHGTHTMGTMVGEDASKTNQTGMAPGAKWIGCRNMDSGNGTPTTYSECYQWFIAPTDLSGQNPDPTKAPHVINNSWGCPASEGCTDPNVLLTVVTNVRAAGILTVHSAGNDGSSCSSVNTPAAIYAQSFSVGATDSGDTIAGFSSRGPVTVDGSNRMKPNISAPGVGIRSSTPGTGYGSLSGTSMAGPHVAGLAALIMSAAPGLKGQVDTLEDVMEQTAIPRTSTQTCGGIPGSQVPNNTYGWGRIDALNAFNNVNAPHTLALKKAASALTASPGGLITYTLTVTHPHPTAPTTNLVLNDVVPANSSFVSATPPYSRTGPIVSWQKASLGPQSTWQVQMVVRVQAGAVGSVTNSNYGVYSSQVALVSGSPVSTTIVPQTLELHKTAAASAISGQPLTYTLTVTNPASMGAAHNLILTDTLPAGTNFHGASPGYTLNNGVVTWTRALLNPGAAWNVQLGVTTPLTATGGVTNTLYAVRSSETPGGVRGPQVATQLQPAYALQFSVHGAATQPMNPGRTIQAVFSITNTGTLTDTYMLTLTSLQGWSTPSWSGPVTLGPGENAMVVAYVAIPPTAAGGLTETTTVDVISAGNPALIASAEKIITVNYVVHLPVVSK